MLPNYNLAFYEISPITDCRHVAKTRGTLRRPYACRIVDGHYFFLLCNIVACTGPHGGTVVKVFCYKFESRWFESRWCHWNFSGKCWQPYHLPVPSSWNLGTLTSWNPLGHSRPVTGLIYLLPFYIWNNVNRIRTRYVLGGPGMGARFSAPVQTGPGAHPASCTMGTGSFPGVKSGRNVTLTPHPLLVPWSWKCRTIPLLSLWAVRHLQSLSACTRVHFTFLSYKE